MTKDIDDKSRVRLSLAQFWGIIVAVAAAAFIVAAALYDLKAQQSKMLAEFAVYRERVDLTLQGMASQITDANIDRKDSTREWALWREQVNLTNARQDGDIRQLQIDRRAGLPRVPLPP